MPPKKRGRPAKVSSTAAATTVVSSDDENANPPAKRTRGNAKAAASQANGVTATAAVPVSDGENANPPAKKSRGKAKPAIDKTAKSTKQGKAKQESDDESEQNTKTDSVSAPANNGKQPAQDDIRDTLSRKTGKKEHKDAQVAKNEHLAIPVDENCPFTNSHRVHIDADGIIYDASLNQTNINNNNNKFYRIQLLESVFDGSFVTWTRWGRVGDRGQTKDISAPSFPAALKEFNSKFKAKSGLSWDDRHQPPKNGKYTFIERSYEPDTSDDEEPQKLQGAGSRRGSKQSAASEEVESQLELPVQHLMQLIFSQQYFKEVMADMNYDSEKLPLGKLSKRTLEQGYEYLKQLGDVILNEDSAMTTITAEKTELTNAYFSTIPHAFGRNRPPTIASEEQLKREIELLESLSDMKIAQEIMKNAKAKDTDKDPVHPLDRQFNGLGLNEMTPLAPKSAEYQELERYLQQTKGSTHSLKYKVEDIFRIERNGEFDRFETSPFGKMSADRRLLWHGSRSTNFGGILSQGLRIAPPEAPVSGYMFGKGVYLADMSSKSANYCAHHSSGNVGLLLLCEAELGKPLLELTDSDYNAGDRAKEAGSYSTWGQGQTAPRKWKDAGCVNPLLSGVSMPDVSVPPGSTNIAGTYLQYNEYIAYDVAQIRLRYLFRVNMGY